MGSTRCEGRSVFLVAEVQQRNQDIRVAGDPGDAQDTLEPGWQVYFGVSDVAAAVQAAVAAGGVVLIEPDEVEEAGTIATLKDPQGGVFSLLEV